MNYKLVILDYDGTIVGRSGVVSNRVKDTIKRCIQKGVLVSISTGRSAYSLKDLIIEMDLNLPHVFLAGALVSNPITKEVLLEDPIEKYVRRRLKLTGEPEMITDIEKLSDETKILNMRYLTSDKNAQKKFDVFQKSLVGKLNIQVGYPYNEPGLEVVNITSADVSKVSALRHLCQHLKVKPSEVMAIGDSPIDLPLIENVGLGIAMGNAKDEVKKKAVWVAPSADNDGVAAALEKFILL